MAEQVEIKVRAVFDGKNLTSSAETAAKSLQNSFSKVKLPGTDAKSSREAMSNLQDAYSTIQKLMSQDVFKDKDLKIFNNSVKDIHSNLSKLDKTFEKITSKNTNIDEIFALNDSKIVDSYNNITKALEAAGKIQGLQNTSRQIQTVQKDLENYKTTVNEAVKSASALKIPEGFEDKSLGKAIQEYNNIINSADRTEESITNAAKAIEASLKHTISNLKGQVTKATNSINELGESSTNFDELRQKASELLKIPLDEVAKDAEGLKKQLENFKVDNTQKIAADWENFRNVLEAAGVSEDALIRITKDLNGEMDAQKAKMADISSIKQRVQALFSLQNAIQIVRRAMRDAFNTVKELDAAMTQTAVVTDFSVGDMWNDLPRYTETANQLGATIKGVYETMTLYYQQGLNTNETFEIGTETLKMARIAGLAYKDATDMMTAALRGFNMELSAMSAGRINDVYSELAAITAADTEEIATAMEKTASIANSAGMEFETTAAFLSQIIN